MLKVAGRDTSKGVFNLTHHGNKCLLTVPWQETRHLKSSAENFAYFTEKNHLLTQMCGLKTVPYEHYIIIPYCSSGLLLIFFSVEGSFLLLDVKNIRNFIRSSQSGWINSEGTYFKLDFARGATRSSLFPFNSVRLVPSVLVVVHYEFVDCHFS